jgi:hypothetical protein
MQPAEVTIKQRRAGSKGTSGEVAAGSAVLVQCVVAANRAVRGVCGFSAAQRKFQQQVAYGYANARPANDGACALRIPTSTSETFVPTLLTAVYM